MSELVIAGAILQVAYWNLWAAAMSNNISPTKGLSYWAKALRWGSLVMIVVGLVACSSPNPYPGQVIEDMNNDGFSCVGYVRVSDAQKEIGVDDHGRCVAESGQVDVWTWHKDEDVDTYLGLAKEIGCELGQNPTYVVDNNFVINADDDTLEEISDATGWPIVRLC